MKSLAKFVVLLAILCIPAVALGQTPQKVNPPDDRYKMDILVVSAHPDDEAFFTPYLARAIYDMHKHVAVIFSTHGGSGVNRFTSERGPAMANEREIEARRACAKLGIEDVWFLDGKDTASQNLFDSFSNWGHGANLERLIGLIRLTRPEVIFTHFPGVFIGENHGDHQATGVLSTEAFDLAGDPMVFPEQLAGPTSHYESYLSNLREWQPKKIYFGSDAQDSKQFDGSGPTYSVREISPSQKKPYWRLAIDSAMSHRTQFPDDIARIAQMSDAELEKMMDDPNTAWWSEPSTLIFGKSVVGGKPTDDVFAHIDDPLSKEALFHSGRFTGEMPGQPLPRMELGGPWAFYAQFYPAHGLTHLPLAKTPEIGIKAGTDLVIPIIVLHDGTKPLTVSLTAVLPDGWKLAHAETQFALPEEASTAFPLTIETPRLSVAELKAAKPQELTIHAEAGGKPIGEIRMRVLLRTAALPE
jgi:LmbE family N-acetylglucosaminyl deacetylase